MSKILVDTNILLRLILQDDPAGLAESKSLLQTAVPGSCRVTALVASELLYVLRVLGYERERSADSFLMLLAYEQFSVDACVIDSICLFQKYALDFVDCYLIQTAINDKQQLKTLDKKAHRLYLKLSSNLNS